MKSRFTAVALALGLIPVLSAPLMAADDDDEPRRRAFQSGVHPEPEPEEEVMPSQGGDIRGRDYYTYGEFVWHAGQPSVSMITTFEGFCFIVGFQGKFDAETDRVHIYVDGNRWKIGGAATDPSVAVAARCIRPDHVNPP
jgi:hypothetical protein